MTARAVHGDDAIDEVVRGIARVVILEGVALVSPREIDTALQSVRSRLIDPSAAVVAHVRRPKRRALMLGAVAAVGLIIAGFAVAVRDDDTNSITPATEAQTSVPVQPLVVTTATTATSSTVPVATATTSATSPSPTTTEPIRELIEPTVIASIAVPDGRMAIAASGGRVWVASQRAPHDGTPKTIVGIDPNTNSVVATIEHDLVGGNALTDAFGSLWACAQDELLRIDPSAATIIARYPVGCSSGLAAGFGSLWLVQHTAVVRFDPDGGTSVATIQLDINSGGWGIAAGPDAVWVSNGRGPGVISRVDPVTNTVAATIPVPFRTRNIRADETGVWMSAEPRSSITGGGTSAVRIDPATNKISKLYNDGIDAIGIDRAGPYLWVVGWGGPVAVVDTRTDQTVFTSNRLKPSGVTLGGERLLWAFGSVWITEQSPGMVARIDPGSYATASAPIPALPDPDQACRRAPEDLVSSLYGDRIVDLPVPECAHTTGVTPLTTPGTCWHVCPDGSDIHGRAISTASPPTTSPDGRTSWTVFARVNYLSANDDYIVEIERITLTAEGDAPLEVTEWITVPTDEVLLIGVNAIQQYLDALASGNYEEAAALLSGPDFNPDERLDLAPLGPIDPPNVDGVAVALRRWCREVANCANPIITGSQPSIDGTAAEAFVTFHDAKTGMDTTATLHGGTDNQPIVTGLPPTSATP